ncbi:MAG: caspase family protein [Geminicoccaceae bacterium]
MFGQRSGDRPIVAAIAVAMAGLFWSGPGAEAGTKTVPTPEGNTCGKANSASVATLSAVIEACDVVVGQAQGRDLGLFHRYRGRALDRSGQPTRALPDYDQALAILGSDYDTLMWRAAAREALGDKAGAIADYTRLNTLNPNISDWRRKILALGGSVQPAVKTAVADATPPPAEPPVAQAKEEPPPTETAKENPAAQSEESLDSILDQYAGAPTIAPAKSPEEEKAAQEKLARDAELAALVRRAQKELTRLGYEVGPVDGVIGRRTRDAMNDWLRKNGRPELREPDEPVVVALEQAPTPATAEPSKPLQVAQGEPKSVEPPPATEPSPSAPPPQIFETKPAPQRAPGGMTPGTGLQDRVVAARSQEPDLPTQRAPKTMTLPPSDGEKRVALVIGNSSYQNVTQLRNPRRDAEAMAAALEEIGFEVTAGYDLDRRQMEEITKNFARQARDSDMALTYYSGHALQSSNKNVLVPVDGQLRDEFDLRDFLGLDQLIQDIGGARKLGVLIVDACRDDPLRGRRNGLAEPGLQPANTLIAYAAAPGSVAYDGNGANSFYVTALLRHLKTPGMDVRLMFGSVKEDVVRDTKSQQRPVDVNTLGGGTYFLVPSESQANGIALSQLTRGEVRAIELSLSWLGFWSGDADGVVSPALLEALRRSGAQTDGDTVSAAEIVALHRRAAPARGQIALPAVGNLDDLQEKAGDGDTQARRLLGQVYDPSYEYGGLQKSRQLARANYKRAANAGDTEAAARLGLMPASPANPPAEQQEARQWLEAAAKAGNPEAALKLAELLLAQEADPAARAQAIELLRVAAAKPDTEGFANALLRDLGYQVQTASSQ